MGDPADPINGQCVLGIDAAWSAHNPSGVALVQRATEGWECLALAPSYEAFLALAASQPWDQNRKAQGSEPDPAALLAACQQLAGQPVDCVSVDMPLATTPITSRRADGPPTPPSPAASGQRAAPCIAHQRNAPVPSPINCANASPNSALACTPQHPIAKGRP